MNELHTMGLYAERNVSRSSKYYTNKNSFALDTSAIQQYKINVVAVENKF